MGLLDALAGRQKEISKEVVQEELKPILLDAETVGAAFKVMRDMLVFTDRRLISIDKQGVTGKKGGVPVGSVLEYHDPSERERGSARYGCGTQAVGSWHF